MTEDEMVGQCHRLNAHEFEQDPGVDDGQGSLACEYKHFSMNSPVRIQCDVMKVSDIA